MESSYGHMNAYSYRGCAIQVHVNAVACRRQMGQWDCGCLCLQRSDGTVSCDWSCLQRTDGDNGHESLWSCSCMGQKGQWAYEHIYQWRTVWASGQSWAERIGSCRVRREVHLNGGSCRRHMSAMDMLTEMPAEDRGVLWACQSRCLQSPDLGIVYENAGACRDQKEVVGM